MSWAAKRKAWIFGIAGFIALCILAFVLFKLFYQPPSCMDGKQNEDEKGIDCGGSMCTYLCSAQVAAPRVRFVRPFSPAAGRTDVIAYIDNPNTGAAAKDVEFTIELYGKDNALLGKKDGSADLPPGALVPVYLPNFVTGYSEAARAFLTISTSSTRWFAYEDERIVPKYNTDAQFVPGASPRITATLTNPSAYTLRDVLVIATVFDGEGNAIAASQTIIPEMRPQGIAGVLFTWNQPFSAVPTRIDVVPVVPLPAGAGEV